MIKANGQRLDSLENEAQLAPWISQKEMDELNESIELNESMELEQEDIPQEGDNVEF